MQKTADEVEAKCEEAGMTAVYTCANGCGKTEGGEEIAALGHTDDEAVVENEKPATCAAEGSYDIVVYCAVCKEELNRETVTTEKLISHTDADKDNVCDDCGDKLVSIDAETVVRVDGSLDVGDITEELVDAGYGSVEAIKRVLVEAIADGNDSNVVLYNITMMYSEDGITWHVADEEHFPESGMLHISLPVPAGTNLKDHDYRVAHMFSKNAFGKTAGDIEYPTVTERKDKAGNEYIDFYVTGLSPVMISWNKHNCNYKEEITTAASCTESGLKTFTCTICGDSYTEEIDPAHTPAEAVREQEVPATCYTKGSYHAVVYCSVCDEKLSETVEQTDYNNNNHYYVRKVDAKDPTCTEDGHEAYEYCTICQQPNIVIIPALDHDMVEDKGKAPTCTETGLTDGKHCSRCDEMTEKQAIILATGHNWGKGKVTRPATSTQEGIKTYTCKNDPSHVRTETFKYDPSYDDVPKTGESALVILGLAGGFAMLCAAVVIFNKKRNTR